MKLVLVWYWRYHCLELEEMDDLDDAVRRLWYMSEAGEGSPEAIETWDDDGKHTLYMREDLAALFRPLEEQTKAARAARLAAVAVADPFIAKVRVRAPAGIGFYTLDHYTSMAQATEDGALLAAVMGEGRVLVERVT